LLAKKGNSEHRKHPFTEDGSHKVHHIIDSQ
jgi:hypothetical protein